MNIKKYNEIADKNKPQKQVLKHTASAFLVGGVIGMIGEFFLNLYKELFSFSEKEATPIMLITLILIAAIFSVNLHSTGAQFRTFHYRIQPNY